LLVRSRWRGAALLANRSGVVASFDVAGTEITFSEPTEPRQCDAVQALETTSERVSYAADDAGRAYRAVPEGWESFPRSAPVRR
jgi:hypothetical protein